MFADGEDCLALRELSLGQQSILVVLFVVLVVEEGDLDALFFQVQVLELAGLQEQLFDWTPGGGLGGRIFICHY